MITDLILDLWDDVPLPKQAEAPVAEPVKVPSTITSERIVRDGRIYKPYFKNGVLQGYSSPNKDGRLIDMFDVEFKYTFSYNRYM